MKLLVFLALVALVSATVDRKPYYRTISPENDERQQTMQLIAEKRERASKIDWNNFNPSAVKNRGPARAARISAFINKMDANIIPPSDTIAPYETKNEYDIESPKKTFGYGYASNYQSAMKTIASGSKINMIPETNAKSSTGYGLYQKSSKYPSLSDEESSAESVTSKYHGRNSGYDSYASDSENISPVGRPPVPTSRMSVGTQESSLKSPTTKYQAKRPEYGSYEDDSDKESQVVRPPSFTSKINSKTTESSAKYETSKYQTKSSSRGSYEKDSDNESHVVRPPAFTSKIDSTIGKSSAKSETSKYQTKSSSRGSYEKDSDNESYVVRPPSFKSKINSKTTESSTKSKTSKYQTKSSSHGSYEKDSKYVSPVVELSSPESEIHVSTPPVFTKSSIPTYPMQSPANNAERLTSLSETDGGKSDETVAGPASKFEAARSFWSGIPTKTIEVTIPNVKLPSSSPKIPVPLVPIRNNDDIKSIRSFVAGSQPTPSSQVSSPLATGKSSPSPSNSMDTSKLMSNSRNTPMNVAQQMRSNSRTANESFAGSAAGVAPKKGDEGSNKDTVHDKIGIYERVKAAPFKPSFYTFPKIPNKYAGY